MLGTKTRQLLGLVSLATISSQLAKRGLKNVFVRGVRAVDPLAPRMIGPAYTLRFIPAREDLDTLDAYRSNREHPQIACVERMPPGHVLVMSAGGDAGVGTAGDLMLLRLAKRGGAGLVSDGGIRDWSAIARTGLPVYGAGPAAPPPHLKYRALDLNTPIGCGGVAVYPGDVLVGDAEGVVVIPAEAVDEVAVACAEQERFEEFVAAEIGAGQSLFGLYPPDAGTMDRYKTWSASRAAAGE